MPLRHQNLDLPSCIREIPDFPKPGILFRDINPLLGNPEAFAAVIQQLGGICETLRPDLIVGIESRGFIVEPWRCSVRSVSCRCVNPASSGLCDRCGLRPRIRQRPA